MSDTARLAALPIWLTHPTIVPSPLGRTNQNFLVADGDNRYFARIGRELPHHGISRAAEAQCGRLAAAHGIGPAVHYAKDGVLVFSFLDGETLSLARSKHPDVLQAVAGLLRRLHSIGADAGMPEADPIAAIGRYLEIIDPAQLPVAISTISTYLARLKPLPARSFVHGDLIPENFIFSSDRIYLIDWEYAGWGAPEFDLALVIANFELDEASADLFLDSYGDHDRAAMLGMRGAVVIREALWCLVQVRHGSAAADLTSYTALCLQRLKQLLA